MILHSQIFLLIIYKVSIGFTLPTSKTHGNYGDRSDLSPAESPPRYPSVLSLINTRMFTRTPGFTTPLQPNPAGKLGETHSFRSDLSPSVFSPRYYASVLSPSLKTDSDSRYLVIHEKYYRPEITDDVALYGGPFYDPSDSSESDISSNSPNDSPISRMAADRYFSTSNGFLRSDYYLRAQTPPKPTPSSSLPEKREEPYFHPDTLSGQVFSGW